MRKFNAQDREVVFDACDLYGFFCIKYYEEKDIMFIFYERTAYIKKTGVEARNYLNSKLPYYNWRLMSNEEWNKRRSMPDLKLVFSIYSWVKEAIE